MEDLSKKGGGVVSQKVMGLPQNARKESTHQQRPKVKLRNKGKDVGKFSYDVLIRAINKKKEKGKNRKSEMNR